MTHPNHLSNSRPLYTDTDRCTDFKISEVALTHFNFLKAALFVTEKCFTD
jgi:hypothetical protein